MESLSKLTALLHPRIRPIRHFATVNMPKYTLQGWLESGDR